MQTNFENRATNSSGSESTSHTSAFLKTDRGKTKSNSIDIPSISLPKGGGAIKGIDEKFSVNAVNGTAGFNIPFPVSDARGFSPDLGISYSSGEGNGTFGLGWSTGLPSIKRKTEKKLPQYRDTEDSDTFLLSGAEDLVPEFKKDINRVFMKEGGEYVINKFDRPWFGKDYEIKTYRPRIEGLFSKIEKWTDKETGLVHWRTISKNNVTSFFGKNAESRIADPLDDKKIFEWLLEFSFDDKGNCTYYEYKLENDQGLPVALHNKNRKKAKLLYTNTYLKRILYGIKKPYKNKGEVFSKNTIDYFFETVLDYGEHDAATAPFNAINNWSFRADAFSEYKPGFEIRTTRLCKRVLLYHHFAELPGGFALIKSINFLYSDNGMDGFSFLKEVTSTGYIRKANGDYTSKSLPPLVFEYQQHEWNGDIKFLDSEALVNAPTGINNDGYQFTDLFSEGLPGILSEQGTGWYYKSNLGGGVFTRANLVSPKPSFLGLNQQLHLTDLEANGIKQVMQVASEPKGFFEISEQEEWQPFQTFDAMPNIPQDTWSRMIDLTGDGLADILVSEPGGFTWYPSKGKKGYEAEKTENHSFDEELAPAVIFADDTQTIFLSDMNGDGLIDIVRIRNGETCYWPNKGYARFGAKISLDNAPLFDHPDHFNPVYLRLADIDGSGTNDIIYLGKNKCSIYLNRQGNSFANEKIISPFPEINNSADIDIVDVLGTGLSCIVWNSALTKDAQQPSCYIDLMNSKKPHIMVAYKNNFGKEVKLEYKASTQFYIEDKLAGNPWITKLHFPVHCVASVQTEDKITGAKFVSSYKYHHGYFDHVEKEFRGFGMVEQTDTEQFEHWALSGASNIVDRSLHQEPVLTKSWFHTGAFFDRENILNQFKDEYWYAQMLQRGFIVPNFEMPLPEARVIASPKLAANSIREMSADEWREALRACKSMAIRSEVFALDAPAVGALDEDIKKQLTPYTVSTQNCVIELLQPRGKNNYAVFIVKESEAINYSYERNTDDPRIGHTLNIKFDEYANVLESASVMYPRFITVNALPAATKQAQAKKCITYTQNVFTNDWITDDTCYLPMPAETKTYELKEVPQTGPLFTIENFKDVFDTGNPAKAEEVEYHEINKAVNPGIIQRRLIEHVRTIYLSEDLVTPLALYELKPLALNFESYQLAFTPLLLNDIYGAKVNDALMTEGKFMHSEGDLNWWMRSGTAEIITGAETVGDGQDRFYLPISYTDPFGGKTKLTYYSDYFLLIEGTEDDLGNKQTVDLFNFRTLSPQRLKDANNNLSEAICDELGFVRATAVFGKGNEADDLAGLFEYRTVADDNLVAFFLGAGKKLKYSPIDTDAAALLQHASVRFLYDLDVYKNTGKPVVAASITREEHFQKNNNAALQFSFEYSNGFGQAVMKKLQAEPGMAWRSNGAGVRTEVDTTPFLRWIGNGRIILNNKGNPVKEYEPYFSTTHFFEDQKELVETGVTPVTYYDALGRALRTELPDGTLTKIEFDSWKQTVYDQNDLALDAACTWYKNRFNRHIDTELIAAGKDPVKEKQAAEKSAKHDKTPNTKHLDCLGRAVLSVAYNKNIVSGADEFYYTSIDLDVEGNLLSVSDSRNNKVAINKYDILGNKVYHQSMDAGKRWMFVNIIGNPLYTWDERNHEFSYFYDILHRLLRVKVKGGDGANPLDHIIKRIFYGEGEANSENKNLRGQVFRHYDTAGVLETPEYYFNGKAKSITRKLFRNYKSVVNWIDVNLAPDIEPGDYSFITETDSLSRIRKETAPDGSVFTPSYNEGGLLTSESISHSDPAITTVYIADINYNEKGQRNSIVYGNGVTENYQYDQYTFRLISKIARRSNNSLLQDIHYTFDAAGNITHIQDNAIATVFYNNMQVEPASEYTYDALYRLVEATGRENSAALLFNNKDNWNDDSFKHMMNPGDPIMSRNYTQKYSYDDVGNIVQMNHTTNDSSANWWTRDYEYEATNNRLKNTKIGQGVNSFTYSYQHHPQHGFIMAMPHLEELEWNFKEELVKTIRQKRNDGGTPEITYYQYDGEGQRLRKITENQADPGNAPTKKEERIYIAGYQIYKKHSGPDAGLERISLSLLDKGNRFVMIETRSDAVDDGTEKHLVRYQLNNHLGSATLELDGSATARVISYEEFHPYGTTAYQAKNAAIKSAAKQYRFTGMERDDETGLEYHGSRYYLPWLGRWLSADSIGIAGGLNLYNYAASCPIALIDNTGNAPKPKKVVSPERKVGQQQQKAFRKAHNMKGAEVQAGHTATVRDAKLSGISQAQWDKIPLMQLHSRVGKGLGVEVTNEVTGETVTNTRHNAQEKISDNLTERSIKAEAASRGVPAEQGKLTPNAQEANALQLIEQLNNVPFDQRNVEAVKKGGPAKKSTVDADLDANGNVKEGPNTTAARERAAAKKSSAPAETSVEVAPTTSPTAEVAPPPQKAVEIPGGAKPVLKPGTKITPKIKTVTKVAGGALNVILVGAAVKDAVTQVQDGDYKGAAVTSGMTVASFTPLAPVVIAAGIINKYETDKSIEARAFEAGDIVMQATGSPVLGGLVSAGNAVGLSTYETGKDMYNSAVDFVGWGVGKVFFDD